MVLTGCAMGCGWVWGWMTGGFCWKGKKSFLGSYGSEFSIVAGEVEVEVEDEESC